MTAPRYNILTQKEITIDLSRPAMQYILQAMKDCERATVEYQLECELDNFCNMLENLLERSEPKPEDYFDLIGV